MLTICYSPHMTSVDNEAGRASGHADVPLSEHGRQQARELGQHYAATPLDAVFCSDLQRAYVTSELAFGDRGFLAMRDARLRECDYGAMTQVSPTQLEHEQHVVEPYPGGESYAMVTDRVGAFLHDIMRDFDGKTIVVVGHRATKYGLEYWCGDASLEDIVCTPWEWRDVPIWRYELSSEHLERRKHTG